MTPDALADLFVLAPVGLVECHDDGRIRQANLAARQLLTPFTGGAPLDDLYAALGAAAPQLRAMVQDFRGTRGVVAETLVVRPSDAGRPVRLAVVRTAPDLVAVLVHEADLTGAERRRSDTPPWGVSADNRDWIIGSLGRRSFAEAATPEVSRARRYGQPLALILVDPDQFRSVVAELGEEFGAGWLATIVSACQRESRGTDTVGRVGDESVAMLLPSTDMAGGLVLAERVRERVQRTPVTANEASGASLRTTVSIGVSEVSDTLDNLEALMAAAQVAVERARQAGSNLVVGYDG